MQEFFGIINTYGFGFTIAGLCVYYGNKFLSIFVENFKNKSVGQIDKIETDLKNHTFFSEMSHNLKVKIKQMDIEDEGLKTIYVEILTSMYSSIEKNMFDMVNSRDIDNMTKDELYKKIKELFDNSTVEYVEYCNSIGIPKEALDKIVEMSPCTIYSSSITVREFCFSSYFHTNTERLSGILSSYNIGYSLFINYFEKYTRKNCLHLNGITYKGLTIKCKHEKKG